MRVVVWSPRGVRCTLPVGSREKVGEVAARAAEEFGLTATSGTTLSTRTSSARRVLRREELMPRHGQYELVDVGGNV